MKNKTTIIKPITSVKTNNMINPISNKPIVILKKKLKSPQLATTLKMFKLFNRKPQRTDKKWKKVQG